MIRRAKLNDLAQLSILFDGYRVFYNKPTDIPGAINFLKNRIQENDSVIFVNENDDMVLTGFVQLYPLFSSTRMAKLWLLNDLFILPEHRGKGFSIALIHECKNLCRNSNSCGLILETATDNSIANELYLKTGFLPDNQHNYYEWENDPT